MNNPKLLAILSLLLAVVVYVRFFHRPIDWRLGGIATEGADEWLERRAGNDKLAHLRLGLPSDITMDGWRAIGTMRALERFGISSKTIDKYQMLPDAKGLRELARLPRLRKLYAWFVEFPASSFSAISELPHLERLQIDYPAGVSSADVASLGRLSTLKRLSMRGVLVDHEVVAGLSRLPILDYLVIEEGRLADNHLAAIGRIQTLRFVDLERNLIRGNGLEGLVGLDRLGVLNLSQNPIDDAGVARLPSLPELGILSLADTRISNTGLSNLPDLPDLFDLELRGTRVTDAGLRHLRRYVRLSYLSLPEGVTGDGLRHLHGLTRLKTVRLGHGVDCGAVEALRRALPECRVHVPE